MTSNSQEIRPSHLVDSEDFISLRWYVTDVQALDSSLTDNDAREILARVKISHDADVGVNWEVIQFHIDDYKEQYAIFLSHE